MPFLTIADKFRWLKRKENLRLINTISISLLILMVILLGYSALAIPPVDAKFIQPTTEDWTNHIAGIDVGLYDNWFFQWHREHVTVTVNLNPYTLFTVSDMANGQYLNPFPIVLISLNALILSFGGMNLYLQNKYAKTTILNNIVCIGLASMAVILMTTGLLFYFGEGFMHKMMVLTLDARLADADFDYFWVHGDIQPSGTDVILQGYNLKSVVGSYSYLGSSLVMLVGVISGILGTLAFFNFKNIYYKK